MSDLAGKLLYAWEIFISQIQVLVRPKTKKISLFPQIYITEGFGKFLGNLHHMMYESYIFPSACI